MKWSNEIPNSRMLYLKIFNDTSGNFSLSNQKKKIKVNTLWGLSFLKTMRLSVRRYALSRYKYEILYRNESPWYFLTEGRKTSKTWIGGWHPIAMVTTFMIRIRCFRASWVSPLVFIGLFANLTICYTVTFEKKDKDFTWVKRDGYLYIMPQESSNLEYFWVKFKASLCCV